MKYSGVSIHAASRADLAPIATCYNIRLSRQGYVTTLQCALCHKAQFRNHGSEGMEG